MTCEHCGASRLVEVHLLDHDVTAVICLECGRPQPVQQEQEMQ